MRIISFFLTADQVKARTKTVTRRLGWFHLKPDTELQACMRARGFRREDRKELGVIRVTGVRQEPLRKMLDDPGYGLREIAKEGFAGHPELGAPAAWVEWFCRTHPGCTLTTNVTRIRFTYIDS